MATLAQRSLLANDPDILTRLKAALCVGVVVVVRDNPLVPFPASDTDQAIRDNVVKRSRRAYVAVVLADLDTQGVRAARAISGTDLPLVDAYAAGTPVTDNQLLNAVALIWDTLAAAQ